MPERALMDIPFKGDIPGEREADKENEEASLTVAYKGEWEKCQSSLNIGASCSN
ncbi:hypothetical protein KDI_18090 [Dictyobacter arantiisoli]|uniref:Uncharacterized protein n=1 Tax=Dictyobacter arantiisoli TaxID=2014874 RepID=A0A5A5TAF6_9CHLR|nr:hypothetical protein KDI_18090 [Dictyobacter arantiisoli]